MSAPDLVRVSGLDTDPGAAARFDAWAGVLADAARHDQGEDHDAWTARELREQEKGSRRRLQVLALQGGDPVGAAGLIAPTRDNEQTAQVFVAVLPRHRRRGVGDVLAAWALAEARSLGRTVLHTETQWGADTDDDPHAAWVERHGFTAAQTVLRSDVDVSAGAVPDPGVAEGYRLETHVDAMPDADLADRAHLARRMSTDAPLGDLDLGEEEWDEERVRGEDERTLAMGRRVVSTFVRDVASGRLVGYTSIQVPAHDPSLAFQHDTLVLREHRGHGLGLALKLANLRALSDAVPEVRTVRTWNAAENTHVLAVNAAMGFRPSGRLRAWQRHLTD